MGFGDLRGKCLFFSILVVLSCGEDHLQILILEPEICLSEVTKVAGFQNTLIYIGHLFDVFL